MSKLSHLFKKFNLNFSSNSNFFHTPRNRKLDPKSFFEMMLNLCEKDSHISLDELALEYSKLKNETISREAIHNRMDIACVWLKDLFLKIFEKYLKISNFSKLKKHSYFADIVIQDSTTIALSDHLQKDFPSLGGSKNSKSAIKIHIAYSLLSNSIVNLQITPAIHHDSKFNDLTDILPKNSLLIKDLGYFCKNNFEYIHSTQDAFFISRLKLNKKIYIKHQHKLIEYSVQDLGPNQDFYCYIENDMNSPLYRCLTSKKESDSKYFLITNLGQESINSEQIERLYRMRWQIELLFKAIKQSLGMEQLKQKNKAYFECVLYAKLIILLLRLYAYANLRYIKYRNMLRLLSIQSFLKKIRYLNISCFQIIFNERNWMETNILEICTKSFTSKSRDNDEKKLLEDEIPFYTVDHTDTFFLS